MTDKDDFLLEEDEDFLPLTPSVDEVPINSDITLDHLQNVQTEMPTNNNLNTQEVNEVNIAPNVNMQTEEKIDNVNSENSSNLDTIFSEEENVIPTSQVDASEKVKNINIHKYVKILPVFAFAFVCILGVYVFIKNVNAEIKNLIKIEEKSKVGYINNEGNVIVKPKYLYGSDYYKGYAIVKNYNNLYGVIDSKGDSEIAFGNIFSANLYKNRYVVSKFTKDGLKMGLLDSNLKEVTKFEYDNISYSKYGTFMFKKNNTMGLMNNDGKEIYSYKVDDVDDKNLSIEISNLSDNQSSDIYAKIKINSSSTIVNLNTGEEVYKYTLDDIRVLDNNVFYVKNDEGNNRYFIIKNNNIVYQTDYYKRLRVEDINSDIAIGIKDDATIDYINLLTKEKINKDGDVKYTYSDGVVLKEMYNFQTNKTEFTVITPEKILGTFSDITLVDNEYVNGYAKIKTENNKYNFINKKGNVLTTKEYEKISDFNKNGYAIVSNDGLYGVIDTSGKEIINVKYDNIKLLDDSLFENINKNYNKQLFIFNENGKYGIINSSGKVVVKPVYEEFKTVTTKYPIIKAKYGDEYILVNLNTFKELSINADNNLQVYEDYIISNSSYYNYDGELIYTVGDIK